MQIKLSHSFISILFLQTCLFHRSTHIKDISIFVTLEFRLRSMGNVVDKNDDEEAAFSSTTKATASKRWLSDYVQGMLQDGMNDGFEGGNLILSFK